MFILYADENARAAGPLSSMIASTSSLLSWKCSSMISAWMLWIRKFLASALTRALWNLEQYNVKFWVIYPSRIRSRASSLLITFLATSLSDCSFASRKSVLNSGLLSRSPMSAVLKNLLSAWCLAVSEFSLCFSLSSHSSGSILEPIMVSSSDLVNVKPSLLCAWLAKCITGCLGGSLAKPFQNSTLIKSLSDITVFLWKNLWEEPKLVPPLAHISRIRSTCLFRLFPSCSLRRAKLSICDNWRRISRVLLSSRLMLEPTICLWVS